MFQCCNSLTDQGLSIDRSGLIVFVRAYKVSCTAEGLRLPMILDSFTLFLSSFAGLLWGNVW